MPVPDRRRALTAAAIASGETWSEPNVPSPMAGINAPLASRLFGTRRGSTPSAAGSRFAPFTLFCPLL